MIVRDEAANLPACLKSCADLFDELVIVDTGSTDATKEIAQSFGANVVDFEWRDDFSAARNESLRHATGESVFWLDADDRLDETNRGQLGALLERLAPETAYLMQCVSHDAFGQIHAGEQARLFPNRETIHWIERIHERLLLGDIQLARSSVVVGHVGYLAEDKVQRKALRNMRLLRLALADTPDDPRMLFHLAGECLTLDRVAEASSLFCRATDVGSPMEIWYPWAIYCRAVAAHKLGVYDKDAIDWLAGKQTDESLALLERLRAHGVRC